MSTADDRAAVVLPVGQYLGASYDGGVAEPRAQLIRVGWQEGELVEPRDIDLWRLAHGAWSGVTGQWSLGDLVRTARDAGISDADDRVAAMDRVGLLRVLTDDRALNDFAQSHCVRPLMAGLGASGPDATTRSLGVIGRAAIAVVDEASYDFWQRGPLAPDISAAAADMSRRSRRAAHEPLPQPTQLRVVVRSIQLLVARGAMYVDRTAETTPPERRWRGPDATNRADRPRDRC